LDNVIEADFKKFDLKWDKHNPELHDKEAIIQAAKVVFELVESEILDS
jgi:hypothetical protein